MSIFSCKLYSLTFLRQSCNLLIKSSSQYTFARQTLNVIRRKCFVKNYVLSFGSTRNSENALSKRLVLGGLLTFFGLKSDETDESELITAIKRGILLMQREEYKKSEQMFHIALKLAQEQNNVEAITYIYDSMANLAYEIKDWEKAEKLFLSVMKNLLAQGLPKNDNKIIHISLKLADIYKNKKEDRKASTGYNFCVDTLQGKAEYGTADEDTMLLLAMALDRFARYLLEKKRYEEALKMYKKAYDTSVKLHGAISEQNVVLLNDMGTASFLLGDYNGAAKYLTEAVSTAKSLPNMEDIASVYVNLGTTYMKLLMMDEAKHACEIAWHAANKYNDKVALNEANICLDQLKVT